jgi:hypothetical protein
MKRSIGRAFLFSLVAFVLINLLFLIIYYYIAPIIDISDLFDLFANYPGMIIQRLFQPLRWFPWDFFIQNVDTAARVLYIGEFLSLIIASIIAGLAGGDMKNAIVGWILTMIFSIVIFIITFFLGSSYLVFYCGSCDLLEAIITVTIKGIVHILIFGCITLLTALMIGRGKKY